jgi:hypothetical protein
MKIFARMAFTVTLASVLAAPLLIYAGGGAGLDPRSWVALPARLADECERHAALTAQTQALSSHLLAKYNVTTDLANGRLSLAEAAGRFRQLDQECPGFSWERFRTIYPGATDGERHGREVICAVQCGLHLEPSRAATVVARLEAELQDHLARHGTLPLDGAPDCAAAGPRTGGASAVGAEGGSHLLSPSIQTRCRLW